MADQSAYDYDGGYEEGGEYYYDEQGGYDDQGQYYDDQNAYYEEDAGYDQPAAPAKKTSSTSGGGSSSGNPNSIYRRKAGTAGLALSDSTSPSEVIQNMRENNSLTRYVQARRGRPHALSAPRSSSSSGALCSSSSRRSAARKNQHARKKAAWPLLSLSR